ncbi:tRNA pseudouridine synthase A [bioreactor metagenome]|uniref:tRNA pseudouridine synthase A n=1 Tax=bioreactor metagenome TaxID=1076179 RepID=A0A645F865_9ZZZZ
MDEDFHARYSAHSKTYRYRICHGGSCSVFEERYVWQLPKILDIKAMRKAAALFLGEHDFVNFSVSGGSVKTTVRNISRLEVIEPEEEGLYKHDYFGEPLLIEVSANGFLYKMVRLITASLVAVGLGRLDEETLRSYVDCKAELSLPPAPAKGLMMLYVDYDVPSSK